MHITMPPSNVGTGCPAHRNRPSILLRLLCVGGVVNGFAAPAAAQSIAEIFRQVRDSVVIVRTVQEGLPAEDGGQATLAELGSGVLIDASGLVLTAAHVVQTAKSVEVEFFDGEKIPAAVLSAEVMADLALLRLRRPPKQPVVAPPGNSDNVEIGDEVLVVGAPLGITHSLSVGHISGRRKASTLFGGLATTEMFQTDAAINQGNSGGPMFNLKGEVIGIVSSILSKSGGFEGIGFAVTSNTARRLVAERPPWWGLDGILISGDVAALLNLTEPVGLLIQRVAPDSPAARAGIRPGRVKATIGGEEFLLGGDVILEVGGVRLSSPGGPEKIRDLAARTPPGQVLPVVVLREGRRVELKSTAPDR
jgi:S1-C subfamily serine protease